MRKQTSAGVSRTVARLRLSVEGRRTLRRGQHGRRVVQPRDEEEEGCFWRERVRITLLDLRATDRVGARFKTGDLLCHGHVAKREGRG